MGVYLHMCTEQINFCANFISGTCTNVSVVCIHVQVHLYTVVCGGGSKAPPPGNILMSALERL